ncbi:hypothetical protein LJ656_13915 [Paraburkholderia sp. MMS20-SJTR3]|uniref:OmpA-like domain-containing protein n=1 Tax=Paraburkholderia sejongensis TaxID=2886946 RepID=A0ABS8JUW5_9BURK|nr:hypothetical protein [Paraburkholderia sp. MMS20-SJTR3]MCC8393687.1 hypothetical protein [Paraburkholderia sp. MMS20-SJTR3]
MKATRLNLRCRALAAALALCVWSCESAYAEHSQEVAPKPAGTCRFLKSVELELPFNTTELSKEQRQTIAAAFEGTKAWPKVDIQAFVTAGAYTGERDLESLKQRRGELVKAYLTELGMKSEAIYVWPKTMMDFFVVKRPDGEPVVQAIYIELTPICAGSCQWMCDDPPPK